MDRVRSTLLESRTDARTEVGVVALGGDDPVPPEFTEVDNERVAAAVMITIFGGGVGGGGEEGWNGVTVIDEKRTLLRARPLRIRNCYLHVRKLREQRTINND